MPVFNAERTVEAAVRAILVQSLRDLELIVQDDGSTDASREVVARLAAGDTRIVVLPPFSENRGVIEARNALLAAARGRFVTWMDADDTCAPERLAVQVRFLEAHPGIGAVGCAIETTDAHLSPTGIRRFSKDPARQAEDPDICCASVMARRDAVERTGGFRAAFRAGGEDGDWLLRMADHARITNVDEVLYTYRGHDGTSRRNAAAIRRLGVLARLAARQRRRGLPDPIDAIEGAADEADLADEAFLGHPDLSAEERATGLSLPLAGQRRLVSVLVPYYDAGAYVAACLDHLARQTFRNFEVLVHDDGSAAPFDAESARRILGDIPLSVSSSAVNQGAPAARNALVARAGGRFLAWQDADDFSREDRLERQVAFLLANPGAQAVGSAIAYVRFGIETRTERYAPVVFSEAGFSGCCATFMLRREAAQAVGSFRTDLRAASEDVDFLRRIEPREGVVNLPDVLYSYRQHDAQTTKRPEWIDAQTYYTLQTIYDQHGLRPMLESGAPSQAEYRAHIDAFFRLRRVDLDRTQFGAMYVRLKLRDVREGRASYLSLLPLAARFPRTMARSVVQFLAHRLAIARGQATAASAPAAPALHGSARPAPVVVAVHEAWGDFDDALRMMTPGGRGIWGDVAFVRDGPWAPDWHIVFNHPGVDTVIRASPNRVVFAIGEPPTPEHRALHLGQGAGTIVLTSDEDLVRKASAERRYVAYPAVTRSWSVRRSYDVLKAASIDAKSAGLSFVTSNAALLPGHRRRLAFLERIRGKVPFDLYGRGFAPIADKWDALAPYRYSIAFENTIAPYYFTEKLMDCFVAETLPLYVGSPAIGTHFPPEAVVAIDPDDPDVVEIVRATIASGAWEKRREAIREAKRLVLERYNTFAMLADFVHGAREAPEPARAITVRPVFVDPGAGV